MKVGVLVYDPDFDISVDLERMELESEKFKFLTEAEKSKLINDMFNAPRDSKDGFIQLSQSISLDDIRLLGLESSKEFRKEKKYESVRFY